MRNLLVFTFVVAFLVLISSQTLIAQSCPAPSELPTCSYTAVNGNCRLTINRMNPVTPPTIYVKRGCSVTVSVSDTSPFEDLTLDWKSSTIIIPPDTFQNAFTSVSGNVGKFTDIVRIAKPQPGPPTEAIVDNTHCESDPTGCDNAAPITTAQNRVMASLKSFDPLALSKNGLQNIKTALQPPPVGQTTWPQPWHDTVSWKRDVEAQLQVPITSANALNEQINRLGYEVDQFKAWHIGPQNNDPHDVADAKTLDDNQKSLKTGYDSFASTLAKLAALQAAINEIPAKGQSISGNSMIRDTSNDKNNYHTQIWTLDYINKLTAIAKRVGADALKSENAALLSGLADPSAKTSLLTITVQFQSPSHFEVTTGLLVPFTPYHSYSKASVAKNGVVVDNIVQESDTYTVVPIVLVNVLAKEWITRQQRSAFFFAGGVGYNPATSTVEFGAGVTYSYRSLAISLLADIGRDTKLGGGFTVGQSLGLGNAANPITSTYWTCKPGAAISVRIPLGGSGSSKQQ